MRRVAEAAVWTALALGLHLAALAAFDAAATDGTTASGDGGEAPVPLEAADAAVMQMVADWDRPPAVADAVTPALPQAPEVPSLAPPPAATAEAAPPMALPRMVAPDTSGPALPVAPQAPPPPVEQAVTATSDLAPRASARPVVRPVRRTPAPPPDPAPESAPTPAPKPATQQAAPAPRQTQAAPAQRAAGQGGGAGGGHGGAGPATTASPAQVQGLMARWGGEIRSRIERRKSYPRAAGGAAGTVQVAIRVGADGGLQALGIAQSSGNAALDQAALAAVQRAGRFPAAPAGLGAGPHSFTLPMAFGR